MNKRNYQKELDQIILQNEKKNPGEKPTLLLHDCCAPCGSYCLEYLIPHFNITLLFYNPNITEAEEYDKRLLELKRFLHETGYEKDVTLIDGRFEPELFFKMAEGMEDLPERGPRCYHCYELRMREAAVYAKKLSLDYFTTTLSISPHKNADWINEIGERLANEYDIPHLPSDFKKRGGYLRSIALSKEYNLYRQDYCGCVFSKKNFS